MIKWPITYKDYNGEEHTEDFYFNLNKAEVMQLDLTYNGAFVDYLKSIVERRDGKEMARIYRELILDSYGEKSSDGRRFVKSEELKSAFEQSEAYVELYMQLATEDGAAAKFMEGVLPKVPSDSNPDMEKHMTVI